MPLWWKPPEIWSLGVGKPSGPSCFRLTLPGLLSGVVLFLLFRPWDCFFIADILGGNKIVLVGSVIQEQITKGRNQPFAAALSAVLMVLTSVMIRLYRKITGTSQLEEMM